MHKMDYKYDDLVDEQLIDECDKVREIAKKSWLSSAHVSLAHLDRVKTKVYNVGLADARELKATNLRERKPRSYTQLQNDPPLTTKNLQQNAWGSNNSIPELIKQHSGIDSLKKPRPSSAIYGNKVRPPSGRKPRPQSAKEPLLPGNETFGVKGAKYDPSGRPPKGVTNVNSTGWVGPPAGLKYPDRPDSGSGWKMEFPDDDFITVDPDVVSRLHDRAPPTPPPPPRGSPIVQEEKTKRVMELFIGDPYKSVEYEEGLFEESDDEFDLLSPVDQVLHSINHTPVDHIQTPALLRKPVPSTYKPRGNSGTSNREPMEEIAKERSPSESLHLSLPVADDEEEASDEMDTDRLLAQAELFAKKLEQQQVFKLNKTSPKSLTQNQESSSKHHVTADLTNKNKAENLVQKIITENGLNFDRNINANTTTTNDNKEKDEHEKYGVKFSEDKNVTVNITPRNLGRKVTELRPNKKKFGHVDSNNFVDLIEVKNRIEPLLVTEKAPLSPKKVSVHTGNRPPSGKAKNIQPASPGKSVLHNSNPVSNVFSNGHTKGVLSHTNTRPPSSTSVASRPRSAPLNRVSTPITTVAMDYGKEERQKSDPDIVTRKVKHKSDDVVTMMQKISMADNLNSTEGQAQIHSKADNVKEFENHDQFLYEINTLIPTVLRSEPEKNYYDISRHSSMSNNELPMQSSPSNMENDIFESNLQAHPAQNVNQVYKTTKTLEFDELQPKEISVKSVIDAHACQTKEKERFLSSASSSGINESRGRLPARPPIGKKTVAKQPEDHSLERPGSRLGFVAMASDKQTSQKTDSKQKSLHRPSSAPSKRPLSATVKGKENRTKTPDRCKTPDKDGKKIKSPVDKEEEREKVIDNLLNRTKDLLGEKQEEEGQSDAMKTKLKVRPVSAVTGLSSRCKDHRRVHSAGTHRPAPIHKHYAAYNTKPSTREVKSRPKSARKAKPAVKKPCIINTLEPDYEDETEEDRACADLEKYLGDKGVNIAAETLQRALYPPSGRSKYYQITASLPKKSSTALLSHPKLWLPQEYKTLQKAEKQLTRANEIMYSQRVAELKRARLAELGPDGLKKKKGKRKGSGKKLRKSKTFG